MRSRFFWAALFASTAAFAQQTAPDVLAAAGPTDIAAGKKVYDSQCALCHGIGGTGGRGPAFTVSRLRRVASGEELIAFLLQGAEATGMPAFWFLGEKPIFQVAAYVRSLGATSQTAPATGNPEHGKLIYSAKGCAGCHVVAGAGSGYGPELTDIGARRNPSFLRDVVLDPTTSLPEGFAIVHATPRNGRAVTGVRLNEDSFTIQLRDAGGKFYSFRKQDLSELKKDFDKSPMPAYRGRLSDSDLDDLVAWLSTLRGKS